MSQSDASDPDASQEAKPKAWDTDSDISSLTPPPSDEEAYFLFQGTALTPKTEARISRRLRQVRRSIGSYNENVLSGSTRKPRRKNMASDVRTETPIAVGDLEKPLVEDPLLNLECTSGALPGANVETHSENKYDMGRRRSTRLRVFDRATRLAEKTKGILGKRRRDTFDAQVENIEVWSERWERNKTSKDIGEPKFGGPAKKRARLSEELRDPELPSSHGREGKLTRPSTAKRWLLHGLYIGQDQDSGTRCSQKRKKPKEPSDNGPEVQRRRFLPMPMFGGHRMIEMGRDFKLPFDVFSPLPPGQPRPEEWKKTHKSELQSLCIYLANVLQLDVFVGEAANVWKKAKPLESSRCVCTAESGCDEECFNRFMFYECDDNNCNIGPDRCTNRSFEQLRHRTKAGGKFNIGVDVIKTLDRGHGVRSNRCFEPNQIIVEYTGEIITQNECDSRMNKRYKDSEVSYPYLSYRNPDLG
jgi:histone-lysine N-methyltransferase ASH1L